MQTMPPRLPCCASCASRLAFGAFCAAWPSVWRHPEARKPWCEVVGMPRFTTMFSGIDPVFYYFTRRGSESDVSSKITGPCSPLGSRVLYFDGKIRPNSSSDPPDILIGQASSAGFKTMDKVCQAVAEQVRGHLSGVAVHLCALDFRISSWDCDQMEQGLQLAMPEYDPIVRRYNANSHFGLPLQDIGSAFVLLVSRQGRLGVEGMRRKLEEALGAAASSAAKRKLSDVVLYDSKDPFLKYHKRNEGSRGGGLTIVPRWFVLWRRIGTSGRPVLARCYPSAGGTRGG